MNSLGLDPLTGLPTTMSQLKKIEKSSGLITAKYTYAVGDDMLDCGNIDMKGVTDDPLVEKFGTLNVTVREVTTFETQINVNFFGNFSAESRDIWNGNIVTAEGQCVSTGVLEKRLLDSIFMSS